MLPCKACKHCVDLAFGKPILQAFPANLRDRSVQYQRKARKQITCVLEDLATHVPLSTDSVEARNGECQAVVSHRGKHPAKGQHASRESTFLLAAIRDHEIRRHFVDAAALPARSTSAGILRQVGVPASNQYRKRARPEVKQTATQKALRFITASRRKLRGVSGWNVFQRAGTDGLSLDPASWRERVKVMSERWRSMSSAARRPYAVRAAAENASRQDASLQPLPTKEAEDLAQISRNAAKKMSAMRLRRNVLHGSIKL